MTRASPPHERAASPRGHASLPRGRALRLRETFAAPALIALLSAAGLVVALLDDGLLDVLAWACLVAPVPIAGWAALRARRRG